MLGWNIARGWTAGNSALLVTETTELRARGNRRFPLASLLGN